MDRATKSDQSFPVRKNTRSGPPLCHQSELSDAQHPHQSGDRKMLQIRGALPSQLGSVCVKKPVTASWSMPERIGIYYVQGIQSGTKAVDPCLHMMHC
jgi:hypothetical protein